MPPADDLLTRFRSVRERSLRICAPLSAEDAQVQSMPDASPPKWHLAHTTWFFETFVLGEHTFDPAFNFLFNSYYDAVGARVERARRGLMTRPALDVVYAYRADVDARVSHALVEDRLTQEQRSIIELGLHHEQQHQELLLTDLKHALGTQPLQPAYRPDLQRERPGAIAPANWVDFAGGLVDIGAGPDGFAYDCERPRHHTWLEPFRLATRPICNAEVLAFIADGGYRETRHWLSEGWATVQHEGWTGPLYWQERDGVWLQYTLNGVREVDPAETACHLSYYEADAIARWAGARLPTEAEWEHAASALAPEGHFLEDDRLHPTAASGDGLRQLYGDVWEWTQSAFAPYPGFAPGFHGRPNESVPLHLRGALGEYNGKFMASQFVLRGGSCFTPRGHVRASYRNFFPPNARWQVTGVRLAADGGSR